MQLLPRLKQQTCTMIKVFFPQEVTDSAAVPPLASSDKQGSIPTAATERQSGRSLQSLVANTGKFEDI